MLCKICTHVFENPHLGASFVPFMNNTTLFSAMNASMFAFNSGPISARVVILILVLVRPAFAPRVVPPRAPLARSPRTRARIVIDPIVIDPIVLRPFVRSSVRPSSSSVASRPRARGHGATTPLARLECPLARVVHIIPYSDPCRTHRRETTTDINAHRASTDHRPNAPRNTSVTEHTDRTHGDTRAIDSTRLDSTRIDRIDRGRASIDSIFIDRIDRSNACME
jgi:hypothetical protein